MKPKTSLFHWLVSYCHEKCVNQLVLTLTYYVLLFRFPSATTSPSWRRLTSDPSVPRELPRYNHWIFFVRLLFVKGVFSPASVALNATGHAFSVASITPELSIEKWKRKKEMDSEYTLDCLAPQALHRKLENHHHCQEPWFVRRLARRRLCLCSRQVGQDLGHPRHRRWPQVEGQCRRSRCQGPRRRCRLRPRLRSDLRISLHPVSQRGWRHLSGKFNIKTMITRGGWKKTEYYPVNNNTI